MEKVAVVVEPGFEEGETLTIVDILRRGGLTCHLVSSQKHVLGGHDIEVEMDDLLNDDLSNYNMIVLPGGMPGALNLKNNKQLIELLKKANQNNVYICAMCAAPIVLEEAGLLKNKKYTAYFGYGDKIKDGTYLEDIVVQDGNIITSRGPATVYKFAYYLLEVLGKDAKAVADRMVYHYAFKEEL